MRGHCLCSRSSEHAMYLSLCVDVAEGSIEEESMKMP